jgi:hypothetical protein
MTSNDEGDGGWFEHAARRAKQGLQEGRVCPLIRLVEGFAQIEPDLAPKLRAWQDSVSALRRADLTASKKAGEERYSKYQLWRRDARLELQVHVRGEAVSVRTIAILSLKDTDGHSYLQRVPLPVNKEHNQSPLLDEFERAFSIKNEEVPVRYLVGISLLSLPHANDQYTSNKTLRQVADVTVHSAERWGLADALGDLERRKWNLARRNLKMMRRKMNQDHAVILHSNADSVGDALERGIPVILATAAHDPEVFPPADWQTWPMGLRTIRDKQEAPDTTSFLVYDAPDYAPWNEINQLREYA